MRCGGNTACSRLSSGLVPPCLMEPPFLRLLLFCRWHFNERETSTEPGIDETFQLYSCRNKIFYAVIWRKKQFVSALPSESARVCSNDVISVGVVGRCNGRLHSFKEKVQLVKSVFYFVRSFITIFIFHLNARFSRFLFRTKILYSTLASPIEVTFPIHYDSRNSSRSSNSNTEKK
jgi:hypothetical protein